MFAPLTVKENLEMGGYLLRRARRGRANRARCWRSSRGWPDAGTPAGKLSGGERKMLAMGRVLMLSRACSCSTSRPPTSRPQSPPQLLEEHVRRLAASGAAVLIVEQRARAVLAISDRTYVLGGGEVRMEGTPAELAASPAFVESFLGGGQPRV